MVKTLEFKLSYDKTKWREIIKKPISTLQVFITNQCNKRCVGCFYQDSLGKGEVSLEEYRQLVEKHAKNIGRVILLGGEPTLHKSLGQMIGINQALGLKTTVYTNGFDLKALEGIGLQDVNIRLGVLGLYHGEKTLSEIRKTSIPLTVVYMLRKDNVGELMDLATHAEQNFNCQDFYISSIRDIHETKSYWEDTADTLALEEYAGVAQNFVRDYEGGIKRIHIARRGIISTELTAGQPKNDSCRFLNVFPDQKKIICPFDISLGIYSDDYEFNTRKCNKNSECLLQKIVLEKI
jgi:hypothetical protein